MFACGVLLYLLAGVSRLALDLDPINMLRDLKSEDSNHSWPAILSPYVNRTPVHLIPTFACTGARRTHACGPAHITRSKALGVAPSSLHSPSPLSDN